MAVSEFTLADRLIAALVSIYYWYQTHLRRSNLYICPNSPDGQHLWVTKDGKYRCKYCPMLAPRATGRDGKYGWNPLKRFF